MRGPLVPIAALALALALAAPAPALAAPPANDGPAAPGAFEARTAENGTPNEREAIAELVEATGDAGVPACLGAGSFERTVWYRVPEAQTAREISVEASGRTLDVVDVAAFVQPAGGAAERPVTAEPNACGGTGAGGADASEEPTGGVILRVPAGRALLVQVGRRGARGSAEDEQVVLSLGARDLPDGPRPAGDEAGTAPELADGASAPVALGGATITEEDPAQPPCPSLGTVWRRVVPRATGERTIVADGPQAATLAVFTGERPAGDDVEGCASRERATGPLSLSVRARSGVPLWIRVGTDRPPADAVATLRIEAPGGFAPGPGPGSNPGPGPGPGGSPPGGGSTTSACRPPSGARLRSAVVRFARRPSRARKQNTYRTFPVRLGAIRVALCSARISLVGPRGRVYARRTVSRAAARRPRFRLRRVRRFVPGTYRLRITARSAEGSRVRLKTRGRARFRG